MTHRLTTDCAKNYCNRTLILKVIVENIVTFFIGTQCSMIVGDSLFLVLSLSYSPYSSLRRDRRQSTGDVISAICVCERDGVYCVSLNYSALTSSEDTLETTAFHVTGHDSDRTYCGAALNEF